MISATNGPTRTRTRFPSGASEIDRAADVVLARVVRGRGAERDLPRIEGDVHRAARVVGAPEDEPAVERDLRQAIVGLDGLTREKRGAGEARDERVGRKRDEVGRAADLEDAPLADDAHPMGERGGVLEVVRDEHRRQAQRVEQLPQLRADASPRVRVESRERLVEQQDRRIPGEGTRQRDPLAFPARELADAGARELLDAEPLEQRLRVCAVARPEADVAEDVEVREERVLLEEVADASPLGRDVDPRSRCRAAPRRRRSRGRARVGAVRRRP